MRNTAGVVTGRLSMGWVSDFLRRAAELVRRADGLVAVSGTVNIENFGFYKIESRKPDDATWSILLAGNQPVTGGALGTWDTRRLTPGEYQISVVPVDTEARTLPRCAVNVFVTTHPLETEEP